MDNKSAKSETLKPFRFFVVVGVFWVFFVVGFFWGFLVGFFFFFALACES